MTQSDKNGQFELTNKQSEWETKVLVANKMSSDIEPNQVARAVISQSWWESSEAHTLFCHVQRNIGENGDYLFQQEYVETRIERLKNGFATAHRWKLVVDDFDAYELCSASDVFNIQMKSKYMSLSLRFPLAEMNAGKWRDCCDDAVEHLDRLEGHQYVTSGKTIMN